MARKKNDERMDISPQGGSRKPVRWINVYLQDEDDARLAERGGAPAEVASELLGLLVLWQSLTLKYVPSDDCFMCSIIGDDPHNPEGSVGLSAYAPTPHEAGVVLLYKWFDLLGEQIPEGHAPRSRRYR